MNCFLSKSYSEKVNGCRFITLVMMQSLTSGKTKLRSNVWLTMKLKRKTHWKWTLDRWACITSLFLFMIYSEFKSNECWRVEGKVLHQLQSPCHLISYYTIVGWKAAGVRSGNKAGIQLYKLKNYADLDHLLGRNWLYRGLNANGDYEYAVLETIDFYIWKCRTLTESWWHCVSCWSFPCV